MALSSFEKEGVIRGLCWMSVERGHSKADCRLSAYYSMFHITLIFIVA